MFELSHGDLTIAICVRRIESLPVSCCGHLAGLLLSIRSKLLLGHETITICISLTEVLDPDHAVLS